MKILKTIASFFNRNPASQAVNDNELKQQAVIASLQLTINELKQALVSGQALLAATEKTRQALIDESVDSRLFNLFSGLSSPLAQLSLLQSLVSEGKEIKTENIFKLISILEIALKDMGMVTIHQTNQAYPFHAESMNPIKPGLSLLPDEKVLVRLPGYSFKGRYICKSLVDKIL